MNQIRVQVVKIHIAITKACGFNVCEDIVYNVEELEQKIKNIKGLNFIHIKCGIDDETPIEVVKVSKFK